MNVKRFTARTSRDALALVRQAFGDDAVVLSTKPSAHGVEVLAMAPESMRQVERISAAQARPAASSKLAARGERVEPALEEASVLEDAEQLTMSTLSFQDYVRDRMLKRRRAALNAQSGDDATAEPYADETADPVAAPAPRAAEVPGDRAGVLEQRMAERGAPVARAASPLREAPVALDPLAGEIHVPGLADAGSARRNQEDMMNELRSMKGLIEERFGALAFMEKLQRQPGQARLTQKLLDCGFSPALIRKLADGLGADIADESAWAAGILERNLMTAQADPALEDSGGVYALVGATGVGKTTTTAKIAAAFATRYGAANLGLVTLDAYRVGAHEQLRAYGRILGVPVHTAHDRASLEDLLDLLSAKKMVLIDTAGMAQRDARTRELLEMLSHRSVQKLLVINAASQGETIEDVIVAYRAASCAGIVLSKMDEAVKLGPALDALIRHKLKVIGVANGQRVPEDWHRLSAHALVQRALRGGGSSAYRLDANDVNLIFTAPRAGQSRPAVSA
ncbi:MAG TPA: flagellar biosynthesis protein FlhF [Caldimonas sp.]